MRDIRFRGKKLIDDSWIYGLFSRSKDGRLILPCIQRERESDSGDYVENIPIDGETLGQYTGLKDKYGVKIYEGDTVGVFDSYKEPGCEISRFVGHVDFDNGSFYIRKDEEYCTYRLMDLQLTIIGNVYDNPELLYN